MGIRHFALSTMKKKARNTFSGSTIISNFLGLLFITQSTKTIETCHGFKRHWTFSWVESRFSSTFIIKTVCCREFLLKIDKFSNED